MHQTESEKKGFSSEKNIVDALCHLVKKLMFYGNPLDFHYFMISMKSWKKELMNQDEDWQDCSNTPVAMQKRLSNTVHRNHQLWVINIPKRY